MRLSPLWAQMQEMTGNVAALRRARAGGRAEGISLGRAIAWAGWLWGGSGGYTILKMYQARALPPLPAGSSCPCLRSRRAAPHARDCPLFPSRVCCITRDVRPMTEPAQSQGLQPALPGPSAQGKDNPGGVGKGFISQVRTTQL